MVTTPFRCDLSPFSACDFARNGGQVKGRQSKTNEVVNPLPKSCHSYASLPLGRGGLSASLFSLFLEEIYPMNRISEVDRSNLATPQSVAGPEDKSRSFNDEVHPRGPHLKFYWERLFPTIDDAEDVVQESYSRISAVRVEKEINWAQASHFAVTRPSVSLALHLSCQCKPRPSFR
jgi:hypothetical protein